MTTPADFVRSWRGLHPKEVAERLQQLHAKRERKEGRSVLSWEIKNEIRPADLFFYLGARFGPPNGFQNFLRGDHSDNIYHWEWSLDVNGSLVNIAGMNFRSEVWAIDVDPLDFESLSAEGIAAAIKADIPPYGSEMAELRKALEHWIEFVNPYQRIRKSLTRLLDDLRALNLTGSEHGMDQLWGPMDAVAAQEKWTETAERYSRGLGLCFGVRSMLPVLAESFINVLMYMLVRTEIRNDARLKENLFRQPIDVRVKSLSINCVGFERPIDYSVKACADFHTLINERNDLLHGNVAVEKLKFNELYFGGKVPVFKEYRTMWDRTIGVEVQATGLGKIEGEVAVVDAFIEYVISCLRPQVQTEVRFMLRKGHLGLNEKSGRLGVLFGDHLVDIRMAKEGESIPGVTD